MTLTEYQLQAMETAIYPDIGHGLVYPTLKLCGEAGEFSELVGKMFRDNNGTLTDERRRKLILELGDVLWYVAACAHELDMDLVDVAHLNLSKLAGRKAAGTIQGSGSDR